MPSPGQRMGRSVQAPAAAAAASEGSVVRGRERERGGEEGKREREVQEEGKRTRKSCQVGEKKKEERVSWNTHRRRRRCVVRDFPVRDARLQFDGYGRVA